MDNPNDIVDRYIAAFNETDADRRRRLLEALYTEDSTYVDPHVEVRGPAGLDAFIAATQEKFPGFEFKLGSAVDAHHNQARFRWEAGPAGQPDPPFAGFDVIVTENGRVRSVYGFSEAATGA
jgi:SnoaL-like domain